MDFWFPKHPTNWLEVCICWRSCPRSLASQKSRFWIYGFSEVVCLVASIRVCILHIKHQKATSKFIVLEVNTRDGSLKHRGADLPSLIHVNAPVVVLCSCPWRMDEIRLPDGYQARVKGIWYVLVPLYYRKYRYVSHAYKTWIQISIIVVYTILSVFITQICFHNDVTVRRHVWLQPEFAPPRQVINVLWLPTSECLLALFQRSNLQITRVLGPWRYMF